MASGGGGTQKVEQTVTNTNLPKYAEPYVMTGLQAAQANLFTPDPSGSGQLVMKPFERYTQAKIDPATGQQMIDPATGQGMVEGAPRIAQLTPEQQAVQSNILAQRTPEAFGVGQQLAGTAGLGALMTSGYDPTAFTSRSAAAGSVAEGSMALPDAFGQAQAQQYMSPYFQNVLDIQKRQAIEDAQKTQLMANLNASRLGTYGGSRQLLAGTARERALGQLLGDIQGKGLQAAYENAQMQFERDRTARMGAQKSNLEAQMRAREVSAQQATQAAIANMQADLEAQKLAEQSKQFGATQGLKGLELAGQSAQTLANLGTAQTQSDIAMLNQQQAAAQKQYDIDQAILSQQYQDFLKEQALPLETLQAYSNIVRGNTIAPGTTSTIYGQAPSVASQVIGTGLGALSTAKLLGA